mmetsp:Transcript_17899/g.44668  ORF Transcript_17899/g.44668 Transcript_17899/m.44668 type:complete len:916 (-) Transcript_17899:96-2843(-)|eukprot:CAMPEP_0178995310 /NCGR_PEP_ID=MMETSP0795-20121207/7764_1 /TAXON_ID=88552 /ORGANISM="Amoebophrya sp., Strain Ameob2" /LENGTH=915 /DNA_ID=CAMNT_0020687619 /DNA_START=101 /DNA_END=2848 /DNA_ORIENTATION=+
MSTTKVDIAAPSSHDPAGDDDAAHRQYLVRSSKEKLFRVAITNSDRLIDPSTSQADDHLQHENYYHDTENEYEGSYAYDHDLDGVRKRTPYASGGRGGAAAGTKFTYSARQSQIADESLLLTKKDWREFEVDSWGETEINFPLFLKTTFYEVLPSSLAGVISFFVDGRIEAWNRFIFGDRRLPFIIDFVIGTGPVWILLSVYLTKWLVEEDEQWGPDKPKMFHWIDIATIGLLKLYRAACIGIKYGYFSPSEMACIKASYGYGKYEKGSRRLGSSIYYDDQGTLEWDILEATFESVLRNSLLLEFQTSQLHVPHDIQVPKAVHRAARASLAILDDKDLYLKKTNKVFKHEHIWHSKYGNLRRILRLDKGNLDRMARRTGWSAALGEDGRSGGAGGGGPPLGEMQSGGTTTVSGSGSGAKNILHGTTTSAASAISSTGSSPGEDHLPASSATTQLLPSQTSSIPVPLLSYAILSLAFEGSTQPPSLLFCAMLGACVCPVVRAVQFGGDYAFGDSPTANVFYALRLFWTFISLGMSFFFASFPYLDAYKRWKLTQILLTLFLDDPEARNALRVRCPDVAEKVAVLNPNGTDLIGDNVENLHAVWILVKVTSPTFLRNMLCRYNNGYSTLNLIYLTTACGLLVLLVSRSRTDLSNETYWPFVFELSFVFLALGSFIVSTVFYGVWANQSLQKLENIFLRANVRRGRKFYYHARRTYQAALSKKLGTPEGVLRGGGGAGRESPILMSRNRSAGANGSMGAHPGAVTALHQNDILRASHSRDQAGACSLDGSIARDDEQGNAPSASARTIAAATDHDPTHHRNQAVPSGTRGSAPEHLHSTAQQQQQLDVGYDEFDFFQTTAADIVAELKLHFQSQPMMFLYRPATPELVNFVYAFVSFLVSAIFSAFVAGGHIRMAGQQ